MIQRSTPQYHARVFIKAEEGGFWHRHHQGVEPFVPEAVALGTPPLLPFVNDSRWLVQCPTCGNSQLSSPEFDRFFCESCLNRSVDGQWLRVEWPTPEAAEAIDAALLARPHFHNRNWRPDESVGVLLAENHLAGLVDHDAGRVAGDIGFDQQSALFARHVEISVPTGISSGAPSVQVEE